MNILIPDDILKRFGSEQGLLIEIACRLYDAEKIEKPQATRLCGLARVDFEEELRKRNLAVYRVALEDFEQDMKTINEQMRKAS